MNYSQYYYISNLIVIYQLSFFFPIPFPFRLLVSPFFSPVLYLNFFYKFRIANWRFDFKVRIIWFSFFVSSLPHSLSWLNILSFRILKCCFIISSNPKNEKMRKQRIGIFPMVTLDIVLSVWCQVFRAILFYVSLSVCMYLSVCPSVCMYIWRSVCLSLYLSVCQSVCVCPSICLYIWLSVCVSVNLSVYQSIYLSVCLCVACLCVRVTFSRVLQCVYHAPPDGLNHDVVIIAENTGEIGQCCERKVRITLRLIE
jgi:hypothetical protein